MKKLIKIITVVIGALFISLMINTSVSAQYEQKKGDGSQPIPDNVIKVIDKTCIKCHGETGNFRARARLNLSKWDDFSPEKQAKKADAMCNMMSKEKMPPKKYLDNHQSDIPTKHEINKVCDWSQSLQQYRK
jgi:hypothetical protein